VRSAASTTLVCMSMYAWLYQSACYNVDTVCVYTCIVITVFAQVDPFDPQGCMVELLKARRTGKMFLLQTKDPVFENGASTSNLPQYIIDTQITYSVVTFTVGLRAANLLLCDILLEDDQFSVHCFVCVSTVIYSIC
jgi:hypothetical protein